MTGELVPSSLTSPNLDILPVPRTLLLAAWGISSPEQPRKLAEPQIVDVEKKVAIHSSVLASRNPWTKKKKKINPWTEEPGELQSMGLQRLGQD